MSPRIWLTFLLLLTLAGCGGGGASPGGSASAGPGPHDSTRGSLALAVNLPANPRVLAQSGGSLTSL
ncbi:MAG: hypothetical protein KC910_06750, partial [Candidatus Eremiobacteraeota bacterium]|nr:hypothetical protein [Candidatus Eremiobacteraeota bacterium]